MDEAKPRPLRAYQLKSEAGNRLIDQLLDEEQAPEPRRTYLRELLVTAMKLNEEAALLGDLKIASSALKELRYAFKVFTPFRTARKVTVFGSARTPPDEPAAVGAREFGRAMVARGWMVNTGGGAGIMGAAQEGAGSAQSFGLNIRLPFEQQPNPWIASEKLIRFKYFFTRKLFLVKEASAIALFPGGLGTMDETFELLNLIYTGKSSIVPVVLVEVGGEPYWQPWERFVLTLIDQGLITAQAQSLYRLCGDVQEAADEIVRFYRVYHSARTVGDRLVLRIQTRLADRTIATLQEQFRDILVGKLEQQGGPLPEEEGELPDLPRLIVPFDRASYGRLRQLIDALNQS